MALLLSPPMIWCGTTRSLRASDDNDAQRLIKGSNKTLLITFYDILIIFHTNTQSTWRFFVVRRGGCRCRRIVTFLATPVTRFVSRARSAGRLPEVFPNPKRTAPFWQLHYTPRIHTLTFFTSLARRRDWCWLAPLTALLKVSCFEQLC